MHGLGAMGPHTRALSVHAMHMLQPWWSLAEALKPYELKCDPYRSGTRMHACTQTHAMITPDNDADPSSIFRGQLHNDACALGLFAPVGAVCIRMRNSYFFTGCVRATRVRYRDPAQYR